MQRLWRPKMRAGVNSHLRNLPCTAVSDLGVPRSYLVEAQVDKVAEGSFELGIEITLEGALDKRSIWSSILNSIHKSDESPPQAQAGTEAVAQLEDERAHLLV